MFSSSWETPAKGYNGEVRQPCCTGFNHEKLGILTLAYNPSACEAEPGKVTRSPGTPKQSHKKQPTIGSQKHQKDPATLVDSLSKVAKLANSKLSVGMEP